MITKKSIVEKISQYLSRQISLNELVDWAETSMQNEPFEERDFDSIRSAIARLGVADVRAFGLTWGDCEELLDGLGYSARVEITSQS